MPAWNTSRQSSGGYLTPRQRADTLRLHGGICGACGHGGAEQVDHTTCWAEWTRRDLSVHDPTNLAPMHGAPCPTCGKRCHDTKTKAEAARARQRAQAKLKHPSERHPGLIA